MPVFRNVYPNRQESHSHRLPPISVNNSNFSEHASDTSIPAFRHVNPSVRESHSRRREPGHIPRPRNAFIIFRSFYIHGRTSAGEGQQNELSKQAGKVWNRLTEKEKAPFVERADTEKKQHQAMYPNYTYSPGRGAARRKTGIATKSVSGPKRKSSATSSRTSSASSDLTFPEVPFTEPTQRPLRVAAQRAIEKFLQPHSMSPTPEFESPMPENSELTYPEPASPEEDACIPTTDSRVFKTEIPAEEDAFVRTVHIKNEELEPQFDLSMRPAHLDRIPEQFGFKYHSDPSTMLACLPPMSNTTDNTEWTGDVPSLFAQLSRHPTNFPAVRMTDHNPVVFLPDGSIAEVWSQSVTHYPDSKALMLIPDLEKSSFREDVYDMSMVSEDIWSEEDKNFMDSFFHFEI